MRNHGVSRGGKLHMELVTLLRNINKLTEEGRIIAIQMLQQKIREAKEIRHEEAFKYWIRRLTKITHNVLLPGYCKYCDDEALEIHHIRYRYPIRIRDIARACRKCNIEQGEGETIWN